MTTVNITILIVSACVLIINLRPARCFGFYIGKLRVSPCEWWVFYPALAWQVWFWFVHYNII